MSCCLGFPWWWTVLCKPRKLSAPLQDAFITSTESKLEQDLIYDRTTNFKLSLECFINRILDWDVNFTVHDHLRVKKIFLIFFSHLISKENLRFFKLLSWKVLPIHKRLNSTESTNISTSSPHLPPPACLSWLYSLPSTYVLVFNLFVIESVMAYIY